MNIITKYRPKSLAEVIGNEEIVTSLVKAKDTHALLFHGESGCGKTTLARIMANMFGCSELSTYEINCADKTGRDNIRDIIDKIKQRPLDGSNICIIMDEAHELSTAAQQTLLKTVEDCPSHVFFCFCSTTPEKIIATLKNRLIKYKLNKLKKDEIRQIILNIKKGEGIGLSSEIIDEIVKQANGVPRAAITLVAKVANLNDSEADKILNTEDVEAPDLIEYCKTVAKDCTWKQASVAFKEIKQNYDIDIIIMTSANYYKGWLLNNDNEQVAFLLDKILSIKNWNLKEAEYVIGLWKKCQKF